MLRLSSKSVSIFANYCFAPLVEVIDAVNLRAYKPIILAVKTGRPRFCSFLPLCFIHFKQLVAYLHKKSPHFLESFLRSGRDSNSRPHA